MLNFALIGLGYVAPKHLKAIKEVGGNLLAAVDPHDSVGVLDSYFPDCRFFTEFERFDRHIDKLRRGGCPIEYVSICSPNYLHDAHCRFALRMGINAICEKPVVINPWNLDALLDLEQETGKHIYPVLQLRYANIVKQLKSEIDSDSRLKVDLKYFTPRGKWYSASWKYQKEKSGGLVLNIGVHLFDLVLHLFGSLNSLEVDLFKPNKASGTLFLERAVVNWSLSIDPNDCNGSPERVLTIGGKSMDLSNEFTNLHTTLYQQIVDGKGLGLPEAKPAIDLIYAIRRYAHDV